MKKSIVILVLIVIAAFAIHSCNKESIKISGNHPSIEGSKITNQVNGFIEDFLSHKSGHIYKNEELFCVDSAVWYIEATINYMYCFTDTSFYSILSDTVYVDIEINENDSVNKSDLFVTFDDVCKELKDKYVNIPYQNKWLTAVLVNAEGPSATQGYVKLKVIAQTGFDVPVATYPLTETDEYWYKKFSNKCDASGNVGAPDYLEGLLYPCYTDRCCYWWVNLDEIPFENPTDFPTGNQIDNYLDYQLFYAISTVGAITYETKCLDYDQGGSGINEMDFYLQEAQDLISNTLAYYPGKLHKSTSMFDFTNNFNIGLMQIEVVGMTMEVTIGNRIRRPEICPYPIEISTIEE